MIKLVIFDLDGVLCHTRDWHYEALNMALADIDQKYIIKREEHLAHFDGLPTNKKLKKLTELKGLPTEEYQRVWEIKQKKTIDVIRNQLHENFEAARIMKWLKDEGFKVTVASNSIRDTVRVALHQMNLLQFIDFYYSNEDVKNPKPSSEMYLKCMIDCGCDPKETVIIEDSHVGRKAVLNTGAHLLAVRNVEDVTLDKVRRFIESLSSHPTYQPKWIGGNMNVVIPMAGSGHSFEIAGYSFPKPLIEINGKTMVQLVVENLNIHSRHIFIVRKDHCDKYNLKQLLNIISPDCEIVVSNEPTWDAVDSVLLAEQFINNDSPLVIANCDQYIEWDANEFMYSMTSDNVDGGVATFNSTHPKWSFIELGEDGYVKNVVEKVPVSNIATCGIYYWSKGSKFVESARNMKLSGEGQVDSKWYVAPAYNQLIKNGGKIKIYPVQKMWGLGTPEEVRYFSERVKE